MSALGFTRYSFPYCSADPQVRPGCINTMKGKQPRSPWSRGAADKLAYCQRQIDLIHKWQAAETDPVEKARYIQHSALFYTRMRWISQGIL